MLWLPITIHPQTGDLCWDKPWNPWPEEGFPHEVTDGVTGPYAARIWPVPRLKDARLVDCQCGRTGLQPATQEAMVRYIPGASLDADGRITVTIPTLAESVPYPTGSGEDEVT
jgi:hypothetical protein